MRKLSTLLTSSSKPEQTRLLVQTAPKAETSVINKAGTKFPQKA